MHVVDGHPSGLSELAIDLADEQLDVQAQVFVIRDFFAAGDHHLDQGNFAAELRKTAQQDSERLQALGDTLGVVHAIDAKDQEIS